MGRTRRSNSEGRRRSTNARWVEYNPPYKTLNPNPTGGALATFDPVNTGPVLFSNVDDTLPPGSANNIDADPLFADVFLSAVFLDVRLTAGSPSIDAGDGGEAPCCLDLDGNLRAFDDPATPNTGQGQSGLWVDHGAFEFGSFAPVVPDPTGACCVGLCLGDMDGDGDIDGDDVQLFVDAMLGGGGLCP